MKKAHLIVVLGLIAVGALSISGRSQPRLNAPAGPQFTPDGKLVRPEGYRRWVYVSSGFGMSYDPNAGGNGEPAFTNVFITPASYEYFQL